MEVPTSSNDVVARPEGTLGERTLAGIVGEEHVLERPDQLAGYFAEPADTDGLVAVRLEARRRSKRW